MPPLKDTANALFELELSGNGSPTISSTPKPCDHNRLVASPPPATNKVTFLTLPVEIRLLMYQELLLSQFYRELTLPPRSTDRTTDQTLVVLDYQFLEYRAMEPKILQTCKQVYHEANPILYSQNVFETMEPENMIQFIEQIGFPNLKLIKTLHLWVPSTAKLPPWLQLLNILAEEESGLRCIVLAWDAEERKRRRELGDDLEFVRAFAKIQGLEKLGIEGYYAKNWSQYLEKRMGVRVRARCAHCHEEGEWRGEDLKSIRKTNERMLQEFRRYPQGTEDLVP